MDIGTLQATLGVDLTQLRAAMGQAERTMKSYDQTVNKELTKAEGRWKRYSSSIMSGASSIKRSIFNMRNAFIAGISILGVGLIARAIKSHIVDVAHLAGRYEELGIAMRVAGKNAGYTGEQMDMLERKVRDQGIAAIEARETLTRMTVANIDLAKSSELARAAQDLAVVGAMNSSDAFQHLIYGIQTAQVRILRTIGLNVSFEEGYKKTAETLGTTADKLTEWEKTQSRANVVLQASIRYQGLYEAAMTSAEKQQRSLKRYVDNYKVALGKAFQPAYLQMVLAKTNAFKRLIEVVSDPQIQHALELLGKRVSEVYAKALDSVLKKLESIQKSGELVTFFDNLATSFDRVALAGKRVGSALKEVGSVILFLSKGVGLDLLFETTSERIQRTLGDLRRELALLEKQAGGKEAGANISDFVNQLFGHIPMAERLAPRIAEIRKQIALLQGELGKIETPKAEKPYAHGAWDPFGELGGALKKGMTIPKPPTLEAIQSYDKLYEEMVDHIKQLSLGETEYKLWALGEWRKKAIKVATEAQEELTTINSVYALEKNQIEKDSLKEWGKRHEEVRNRIEELTLSASQYELNQLGKVFQEKMDLYNKAGKETVLIEQLYALERASIIDKYAKKRQDEIQQYTDQWKELERSISTDLMSEVDQRKSAIDWEYRSRLDQIKHFQKLGVLTEEAYTNAISNAEEARIQLLKKTTEEYEKDTKIMIELSQRTAEAIEQNFSDFFFDTMKGELKSLEDYWNAFLDSIQRSTADVMGQLWKELLVGKGKEEGGQTDKIGGVLGSLGTMVGDLFGGGGGGGTGLPAGTEYATPWGFADGGIVRKPTLGILGEAGPEAVIPLDELNSIRAGGKGLPPIIFNITTPDVQGFRKSQDQIMGDMIAAVDRVNRRNT